MRSASKHTITALLALSAAFSANAQGCSCLNLEELAESILVVDDELVLLPNGQEIEIIDLYYIQEDVVEEDDYLANAEGAEEACAGAAMHELDEVMLSEIEIDDAVAKQEDDFALVTDETIEEIALEMDSQLILTEEDMAQLALDDDALMVTEEIAFDDDATAEEVAFDDATVSECKIPCDRAIASLRLSEERMREVVEYGWI